MFTNPTPTYLYDGLRCIYNKSQQSLIINDQGVREFPRNVLKKFRKAKIIDVSGNKLATLVNFDVFTEAHTIILDSNTLTADGIGEIHACMKNISTLFINKNKITNRQRFCNTLCNRFPNLIHLSCMLNPFYKHTPHEDSQFITHMLPRLQFLNAGNVDRTQPFEMFEKEQLKPIVLSTDIVQENQDKQQALVNIALKKERI
ncbi:hypothetical protein OAB94_02505 [Flavobacteriaceae bacterium]|nr:hypothetical protein [Flavobacteriaceae bacterium]